MESVLLHVNAKEMLSQKLFGKTSWFYSDRVTRPSLPLSLSGCTADLFWITIQMRCVFGNVVSAVDSTKAFFLNIEMNRTRSNIGTALQDHKSPLNLTALKRNIAFGSVILTIYPFTEQGWRNDESTRLVEFVSDSRTAPRVFFSGSPIFLPPRKWTSLNSNLIRIGGEKAWILRIKISGINLFQG